MTAARRRLLVACLVAAIAPSVHAADAAYPGKPIRLVVPFAPGGSSDTLARVLGQRLAQRLGQPIVVENRAGAGTTVGTAEVAKAPGDGYTLLLAPAPFVIAPLMYANLPYDAAKDFTGVALVATSPLVLTAGPAFPRGSIEDIVAQSKAKPGALTYASPGNGSVPHLAAELFKLRTGADLTHVPYKGAGPAVIDLLAGNVALMFASPIEVSQHVAAKKLRYLAATTARRVPGLPDVPTVSESPGLADFDVSAWFGIVAPSSTPPAIVSTLSAAIGEALAAPDLRASFAAQGAELSPMPAAAFDRFLAREREVWARAIKASGAKID